MPVPSPDSDIELIVTKTLAGQRVARGLTNDNTNVLGNYQRSNLLKQAQERVATQALTAAQNTIIIVVWLGKPVSQHIYQVILTDDRLDYLIIREVRPA